MIRGQKFPGPVKFIADQGYWNSQRYHPGYANTDYRPCHCHVLRGRHMYYRTAGGLDSGDTRVLRYLDMAGLVVF